MFSFACIVFAALVCQTNEILRTVAQVSAIPPEEFAGRRFDLTGQIIAHFDVHEGHDVLHDETGNFEVRVSRALPATGVTVRVQGVTCVEKPTWTTCLESRHETILGPGEPVLPKEMSIQDVLRQREEFMYVTTHGTVIEAAPDDIDPRWVFLTLKDQSSFIYIAVLDNDGTLRKKAAKLLDARIKVTGFLTSNRPVNRSFIDPQISLPDISYITVEEPASADPFALPELRAMNNVQPNAIADLQRRTLEGVVIAVWGKDNFLLEDGLRRIVRVKLRENAELPAFGDHVKVVGFPQTDLYHINVAQGLVKKLERARQPPTRPEDASAQSILLDADRQRKINLRYHGRLIRLLGEVRTLSDVIPGERVIHVDSDGLLVPVDVSALPNTFADLSAGCKIEVTGVCVLDTPNWSAGRMFPRVDGLILVPRAASDVRVLSRPPWWTPGRLLAVIGGLVSLLIGIFGWNVALRKTAERRGRELYRSGIAKANAELRINERTRLAVELHDSIAQNLTGAFFQIEAAEFARTSDPPALERCLKAAMQTLQSCRAELRNCLWDLRNNALDETDASDALRRTLAPHVGSAELAVEAALPRSRISDNTFHALLSIARELVSNAARHGKARHISASAAFDGNTLRLTVADDGCGFDPNNRPGAADGHFGLQGITDRIHKMSGRLEIDSRPGQGARITVTITPEAQNHHA